MGSETKGQDYRFENLSTACRDCGCHIEDVWWRSSVMDGCDYVLLGELDRILPTVHSLTLCLCSFLSCFLSVLISFSFCVCLCVFARSFCATSCVCLHCSLPHRLAPASLFPHQLHATAASGSPCTVLR